MVFPLPQPAPAPASDPYFRLGDLHLGVSTRSVDAQSWFDRALVWTYCFNHDEAVRCYQQVMAHDPACALAYWGVAFCSGANYNKTWRLFDGRDRARAVRVCHGYAREALARAEADSAAVTPWETALIRALARRFPDEDAGRDFAACDRAYADAMREVYLEHGRGGDDLDMVTLFADALMNCAPRKLYDAATGQPNPDTPVFEAKALLEDALRRPGAERHPGPAHMYIHLMEMSSTPGAALPAAAIIRDLIPDTGHTFHMPAHIDVLVGDYARAVEYNGKACDADDRFFRVRGGGTFYSYYRLHDYHSLVYAAMLGGMSAAALSATRRMEEAVTEDMLRCEDPLPLADWMEFFLAVRVHVLVRFGMWDDLKALQPLAATEDHRRLYCVTNVMRHYGKAIAHAATGQVEEAERERELYRAAAELVPPTRLDFPNRVVDILRVASAMLDGEIAYRKTQFDAAFASLREAVRLEDALPFAEPWGWMLPARHAYAALSLERGLVEQAAVAYAEDLGIRPTPGRSHQHPGNVWALHGYHECLVRLGAREEEVAEVEGRLRTALEGADVDITSSCFCRVGAPACCGGAS
ncbi:hypothetical protein N3K66_007709 [Trichothecium roseum]|uniref:Uncharacterized protein n=1 Tax=Trichothecium roseum TaxID=47278 RepID=A0ACC0UUV1_9HYPO|nr:hypothetical protein N3K66_007709 [Trichothecium roseum]